MVFKKLHKNQPVTEHRNFDVWVVPFSELRP